MNRWAILSYPSSLQGLARSGDAGTLVLGDAQAQGLSGPGGGHGVPLLFGDADGEEAAVRVPLVLQELLRHEPGALERLVACLEAGEVGPAALSCALDPRHSNSPRTPNRCHLMRLLTKYARLTAYAMYFVCPAGV